VVLKFLSLTSFVEAHISPDEIRGDTLFWYHDQLNVSEIINIGLVLRIAGVEFIGETIQLKGLSYINGIEGNLMMSSSYDFQSEIRCGYDPNDKLVLPNRSMEYGLNYTLFEESLEYTIRFQNTGTDTAFNIVIKDVLDERLDWTTFQPITSSHPFETTLHSTGLVEFSFKNILLVDSIANELLSHGFVTYKISSKKELPENMHIENTANIYFDFNPPIITNTTTNVLVSQLPQTTSLNPIFVEQSVKVYPNPFKDYLIVEQSNKNFIKHSTISFFDVTGRRLQDIILTDVIQQIPISYLGKGLYFYQVITVDGNMIANGLAVKN